MDEIYNLLWYLKSEIYYTQSIKMKHTITSGMAIDL